MLPLSQKSSDFGTLSEDGHAGSLGPIGQDEQRLREKHNRYRVEQEQMRTILAGPPKSPFTKLAEPSEI
jgi:hypothetical protein